MTSYTPDDTAAQPAALASHTRSLMGKLRRQLREHSNHATLTQSQISVVLQLEKSGPATVSELARAEHMRSQSMSPIVASLVKEGLVAGTPDEVDGRKTRLILTEAGRKWLETGRSARQDWLSHRIEERLSETERTTFASALDLLTRLVED
ncbi:DNA-binding MarR family transcriptional regulator [Silvimonas terrae]|uniref:DNA-binding MarR family transcriptional regulator n=1 Tax=Silvimonas terrae TaxID=300266 RepID=A0A840RDX2_9NEIS|nr:MarR family transcriptional regulator [Silvimonas terrae]MBB5191699.1 DNA-binding MarR family transcriptional regulator [Silvimonas terrae]